MQIHLSPVHEANGIVACCNKGLRLLLDPYSVSNEDADSTYCEPEEQVSYFC